MTDRSVKHSTFTLERSYAAALAAVFAAWSDPATKAMWFAPEDGRYTLDFRVGGIEAVHGGEGVEPVATSRRPPRCPRPVRHGRANSGPGAARRAGYSRDGA